MVIPSNFPCTCVLVLVKNRLYVLFVPSRAQWYMDAWPFGFMAKWIHGSLDSWHNGCMAAWIHGTMDEYSLDSWHNGCIAVWSHGTMDMWQFGCMVFSKTSPRHLRSSKIKTHYVRSPSFTVKAQKLKTPKLSGELVIFCRCFNLVDR